MFFIALFYNKNKNSRICFENIILYTKKNFSSLILEISLSEYFEFLKIEN